MTDAAWSPQVSTVFALSTVDGKVHVYDLSISQYNPLCVQAVVNRSCVAPAFKLMYCDDFFSGRNAA